MPCFGLKCDMAVHFFSMSGLRRLLGLLQRGIEPGSGKRPIAIGGTTDDAQRPGRLIERKPREETELDQFGTDWVFLLKLVQGIIEGEKFFRGFRDTELDVVKVQSPPVTAALESVPFAGTIDEDAAHGLGRGGKEMSAAVPTLNLLGIHQPYVSFMD